MERRQFARIAVSLRLRFKNMAAFESMAEGAAADLSPGGMFIRTTEPKAVGTVVELELPLPDARLVSIHGVVRGIRYERGQPVGMGLEFTELAPEAREIIESLIARHSPPENK